MLFGLSFSKPGALMLPMTQMREDLALITKSNRKLMRSAGPWCDLEAGEDNVIRILSGKLQQVCAEVDRSVGTTCKATRSQGEYFCCGSKESVRGQVERERLVDFFVASGEASDRASAYVVVDARALGVYGKKAADNVEDSYAVLERLREDACTTLQCALRSCKAKITVQTLSDAKLRACITLL